ncbi:MAG TPA: hypothetical protein DCY20_12000 [Firmicutes bacterium]|nr:hypothetical protein [Bacillota bacterium]
MSWVSIMAIFLLTFIFLFLFEFVFSHINIPKWFFITSLKNRIPYLSRVIVAILILMVTEFLVGLSGDLFFVSAFDTNVLRIFGISFLYSFITHQ